MLSFSSQVFTISKRKREKKRKKENVQVFSYKDHKRTTLRFVTSRKKRARGIEEVPLSLNYISLLKSKLSRVSSMSKTLTISKEIELVKLLFSIVALR